MYNLGGFVGNVSARKKRAIHLTHFESMFQNLENFEIDSKWVH